MNFNDTEHINMTTLHDNRQPLVKMGLDNTVCDNPQFFCRCHKVYLSPEDVERKNCCHKLTLDMISYVQCRWLVDADAYEEKNAEISRNITNIRKSKINNH